VTVDVLVKSVCVCVSVGGMKSVCLCVCMKSVRTHMV